MTVRPACFRCRRRRSPGSRTSTGTYLPTAWPGNATPSGRRSWTPSGSRWSGTPTLPCGGWPKTGARGDRPTNSNAIGTISRFPCESGGARRPQLGLIGHFCPIPQPRRRGGIPSPFARKVIRPSHGIAVPGTPARGQTRPVGMAGNSPFYSHGCKFPFPVAERVAGKPGCRTLGRILYTSYSSTPCSCVQAGPEHLPRSAV